MSSNNTKASRQGRYRKSLIDPQSLLPIAKNLEAFFNGLDQKRQAGMLNDAEFLSSGLLILLACRRTDAFQRNGRWAAKNTETKKNGNGFTIADLWALSVEQELPLSHYQKILDQKIPVYGFLQQFRFRGIPDSAQTALLKWLEGQYPLTLWFHIPSADEVFELQKNGGRCISFLKQAGDLTALHHHRDAVSFIVHDLIHAHEFYAIPQRARQQIGFYHWLDNIRHNPQLIQLLRESDGFRAQWEYVLSDMNSYCGHLLKTLHAAFAIYVPSGEGNSLWHRVVDYSDLEAHEKTVFRKINSTEWSDADFFRLESILEKRFERSV